MATAAKYVLKTAFPCLASINKTMLSFRGFRLYWSWKSRHPQGRPSISREIIDLIRKMSLAAPRWGAPRIHGPCRSTRVNQQPYGRVHGRPHTQSHAPQEQVFGRSCRRHNHRCPHAFEIKSPMPLTRIPDCRALQYWVKVRGSPTTDRKRPRPGEVHTDRETVVMCPTVNTAKGRQGFGSPS